MIGRMLLVLLLLAGIGCPGSIPPPPGDVSDFTATATSDHIELTWVNPTDPRLTGVRIQRDTATYPVSPYSGITVFDGPGTQFIDIYVTQGATYYYGAFARDNLPDYSFGVKASATVASSGGEGEGEALPHWVETTKAAPWIGRWGHAAVGFAGRMWIMGGTDQGTDLNDVWNSSDGVNWVRATAAADWPARGQHAAVVYGNQIWVLGGVGFLDRGYQYFADVWSSPNGVNWMQVTDSAPWMARAGHMSVVHNGRMWVLGGYLKNDVWFSSDGVNWTQATDAAPWSPRAGASALVFNGHMWVIGGELKNDVWFSDDGADWTEATSAALWPGRMGAAAVAYQDKMVVLGGDAVGFSNDVWYSTDGVNWAELFVMPVWSARYYHASVVLFGKMWVIGGFSSDTRANSFFSDVWSYAGPLACVSNPGAPNAPPVAQLTADSTQGVAPLQVLFEAIAVDPNCNPLTYTWRFGDDTIQQGAERVVHTYTSAGTYVAEVDVSDGLATVTESATVRVDSSLPSGAVALP